MTENDIAIKLTEVESRAKSNTHRIEDLENQQEAILKLATAVEVMANEQKHQTAAMVDIKTQVDGVKTKVDTLEKVPAKRWELVITSALAILVTYLLAHFGIV